MNPSRFTLLIVFVFFLGSAAAERSRDGLEALYDFGSASGEVVRDKSGAGIDLRIRDMGAIRRAEGSLEIINDTLIESNNPSTRLIENVRKNRELSIEAWVRPQNLNQEGPARIVTLSHNSTNRNFTLGQERNRIETRVRTEKTDNNGLPSTDGRDGSLKMELSHVVYTLQSDGRARIFVNGQVVGDKNIGSDLSKWDGNYKLALGNEFSGDRLWKGTYYLVAVYSQELDPAQIQAHFKLGPGVDIEVPEPQPQPPTPAPVVRANAEDGLIALYDFAGAGNVVKDVSGAGTPIDLRIQDMGTVRREPGVLEIRGKTHIRSDQPATRIQEAIRESNEFTVEAWVEPANTKQEGPARMVTLSRDTSARNFTLGQEANFYDVRFRSTRTNSQGQPSLDSPRSSVKTELTHLVYTRDRGGKTRLFLNGKQSAEGNAGGDLGNWDRGYRLAIGNEMSGDRQWLGKMHHIAIYSRALSPGEAADHFEAGAGAKTEELIAKRKEAANKELFETKVAPLLANACLECHDSSTRKGKLDLSIKESALTSITPGSLEGSDFWHSIESDEMPKKRDPLTDDEKQLLKDWIKSGATWTLGQIDPVIYQHAGHDGDAYVQRLTIEEYIATVKATVGVDIGREARHLLPPELRADGFSNTAYNLTVDLKHVEAYAQLAKIIVERMDVEEFAKPFRTTRGDYDDRTRGFVSNLGKWILRGPLTQNEIDIYSGIETAVNSTGGNFSESTSFILEAMLQAPRFIYRIENQRGGVDNYEIASRMSYIIWGAPPDRQLLDLADAGRLSNRGEIEAQARRMLDDSRAVRRSLQFAEDWLDLGRLNNLSPNAQRFPDWNANLAEDMREESLAYFEYVVWDQQLPMTALLNTQKTFASPRLAEHYGLASKGDELTSYDVANVPGRGGLLTQGSILTIGGDNASMVTRGLFVMHDLLRGVIKDPPPCVDTTPVPTKAGLTQRAIAEERVADNSCGGCHSKFEPLAYGLEKFDGIGAWRDIDRHGNELREDGEILLPGAADPIEYQTSAQLMDLLAESDRVRESLAWKFAQYALGRPLGAGDAGTMSQVVANAQKNGGTYQAIVTALATSDLVMR
ncbi:MAG: LamG-like jellyroll fold domain-containing protein [Verrucomicrobiota bacterium]